MDITLQILRQSHRNIPPELKVYRLSVPESTTILDCLNQIKWQQDGSLAFRKNCRNTICGSCAITINGRSALACKENVGSEIKRLQDIDPDSHNEPVLAIAPLKNMPIIKDLVVDMQGFWDNLEKVEPYVSTASRAIPEREFLQTPAERAQLNQTGNCILCGACYSECNAVAVNPKFAGPHALAKAQRMVVDSRDNNTDQRLENYHDPEFGVWACTRCYQCNSVCPQEVAPMDQITQIKGALLQQKDPKEHRTVRHRKTLINLVKDGGWIDERRFAFLVMGLQGVSEIFPLGWRMLTHGKLPISFEASPGATEVKGLIEQVESLIESGSDNPVK
ncbi:succinate dehydrogenase/fumarate reductase iron-sulfur subunit [[Limnothrix rosea] IAM M-220]|uniref:succinate dehydrogenase/fumarate reductase iron-sulfur subunit n=1 Tax=[Limnothrix rosea] IAM M-220 TaxID=454133 RepID=UPI000961B26F|nr:succinate dehydrogenase/fumarate reductase iron-sulfur subunit [[Limnothrix rosea] IAM M-220]OKH19360.1 succinate dehydrogenase [[Limnothrix rosea] IAM M-220]